MRSMFVMSFGVLLLGLVACGGRGEQPKQQVHASHLVGDSFVVAKLGNGDNKAAISIRKSALDKEFLLQSGSTLMPWLGSSQSNKSRIVAFVKQGRDLYLMEATEGHTVTAAIDQKLILTKFPILGETEGEISFDFNVGMSALFLASDWRASDYEGSDVNRNVEAEKVRLSYIEDASLDYERQQLVIRQLAQIEGGAGGKTLDTVEVKYYLTPYEQDETFTATESLGFKDYGFFEVAPRYVESKSKIFATKFGEGPITFAISANTPSEYRQAVVDGVLYWNKAFGEQRVVVTDAPEGLSAPDFNHNIVQWIDWDTAGFAYADAQADPRTGKILHAQVYMTSVFATSGRDAAKRLLEELSEDAVASRSVRRMELRGFERGALCFRDLSSVFAESLRELVESEASDEQILKASQDYVREVIAHEIGHTLGLRHNFAGSLAASYSPEEKPDLLRQYFESGTPAGTVPSSSVMEYQVFGDSIMTGDLMVQADAAALPYDIAAIKKLYLGEETADKPVFCTDTERGAYVDCEVFDVGRTPFEILTDRAAGVSKLLARTVAVGEAQVPIVYVLPTADAAQSLSAAYSLTVKTLHGQAKVLTVRRTAESPVEAAIEAAERDFLLENANAFGGLGSLLRLPELPAPGVDTYSPARAALASALAESYLSVWREAGDLLIDHQLGEQGGETLSSLVMSILTSTTGETTRIAWNVEGQPERIVELPTFTYPAKTRLAAAELLQRQVSEDLSFSTGIALRAHLALSGLYAASVGAETSLEDVATAPRPIARFVIENDQLLDLLKR